MRSDLSQKSVCRKPAAKSMAITWARKQTCGGAFPKLILMILADASNKEGWSFLSQSTIAERAEMDRKSVNRHMKSLEDAGLIIRVERWFEGKRSTDHVQIQMPSRCTSEVHPDVPEGYSIPSTPYGVRDRGKGARRGVALRVIGGGRE